MRSFTALLAIASFAALSACDVDKTEEGEAPEIDIDANAGEAPEYDVDGPEVNVGTTTENVTLPTVDVDTPEE